MATYGGGIRIDVAVSESYSATGLFGTTTQTIYTVPPGRVLVLTLFNLSSTNGNLLQVLVNDNLLAENTLASAAAMTLLSSKVGPGVAAKAEPPMTNVMVGPGKTISFRYGSSGSYNALGYLEGFLIRN